MFFPQHKGSYLTTKKTQKKSIDFDEALNELEGIVKNMEQGNLGLEQSLKQFEAGVLLAKSCQKRLDEAELQVKQLIEEKPE